MPKKLNNNRRFPGEKSRNRPDKAEKRRTEATDRQLDSNKLSTQQKLDRLDIRFGVGVGAKKERKRLQEALTHTKNKNNIEGLEHKVLPDDIMQEIETMNESGNKKKLKAKDRRAQEQKYGE